MRLRMTQPSQFGCEEPEEFEVRPSCARLGRTRASVPTHPWTGQSPLSANLRQNSFGVGAVDRHAPEIGELRMEVPISQKPTSGQLRAHIRTASVQRTAVRLMGDTAAR